jgi:hypothetical protein
MIMLKSLLIGILALATTSLVAQVDSTSWFAKNVQIGQSSSSSGSSGGGNNPAQVTATFPQHSASSYLINLGVAAAVLHQSNAFTKGTTVHLRTTLLNLTGEYHRNSLTDSVQNNTSFGLSLQKFWGTAEGYKQGIEWTAKYLYDAVKINNSLATEFYYLPIWSNSGFLYLNTNGFINSYRVSYNISPDAGFQLQDVFAAKNDSSKGLIIRPVFAINGSITFNRKATNAVESVQPSPLIGLTTSYTGRWDAENSTKHPEGYTYLFNAALNYFIIGSPAKVSIGPSYHIGSDPMHNLKQQQYWLIALNISKSIAK